VKKPASRKATSRVGRKRSVVVIELSAEFERRVPDRPHLYVAATSQDPGSLLADLSEGRGPRWISGRVRALRPDLVLNYKPTTSSVAIQRRLNETRSRLSKLGFAVNGDARVWSIYVLDINADAPPALLDRGRLNKVIYVGQTSKDVTTRVLEHQGLALSKKRKYLGAPSTKGRSPRLNTKLTPTELYFTEGDAKKAEAECARKLKRAGYRVLGDGLTDIDKQSK
jgi:hypothetical protein